MYLEKCPQNIPLKSSHLWYWNQQLSFIIAGLITWTSYIACYLSIRETDGDLTLPIHESQTEADIVHV